MSEVLVQSPLLQLPTRIPRDRDRLVVTQANDLARSIQSFTLHQKRMLLLAIAVIRRADEALRCIRIEVADYQRVFGLSSNKGIYGDLLDAVTNLHGATLTVLHGQNRRSRTTINVVHKTTYMTGQDSNTGRAYIDLWLHEEIAPYLLNLEREFHSFPLPAIAGLRGVHSIRLVEILLADSLGRLRCTLTYDLESLQLMLGSAYTRYTDVRRRILEPAIEEINQNGFLNVRWTPLKEGKAVKQIVFNVRTKSDITELSIVEDTTIHSLAAQLNFDGNLAPYIRKYGSSTILSLVEEVRDQVRARQNTAKEIQNTGAYLNQRLQTLKLASPSPKESDPMQEKQVDLIQAGKSLPARIIKVRLTGQDIARLADELLMEWRQARLEIANQAWVELADDERSRVEGAAQERLLGNAFAGERVLEAERRTLLGEMGLVQYPPHLSAPKAFAEAQAWRHDLTTAQRQSILELAEELRDE